MMKKSLLFFAMAMMPFAGVFAQEEGGEEVVEQTPIIYTKSFQSLIDDAKSIVADSHYTQGQSDLQGAIATAESQLAGFANPEVDVDETATEAMQRLNTDVYNAMTTLQTAIDEFVFANQHADATEKVLNNSFSADATNATNITSWVTTNFKQNSRTVSYSTNRRNENGEAYAFGKFVEQWSNSGVGNLSGSGDIHQVVSGLPAGHYRLSADIFVHNQKYSIDNEEAVGVEFYANDAIREVGMVGFADANVAAFSIDFDLANGEDVTIGLRWSDVNFNWLGWDNVTLLFIGDPDIYNSIADVEKLNAAREALAASLATAKETLDNENAPLYRIELQDAINAASEYGESATLEELEEAKATLDGEVSAFNQNNRYFTNLQTAIENAETLLASMTEGTKAYNAAIEEAKTALETAKASADQTDAAIEILQSAQAALEVAESDFRIANASYANPANVITNGNMDSTAGWEILKASDTNPDMKINKSGDYALFSKPFMECWNTSGSSIGQENYARQAVTALPNGLPLPAGYYVLKAAALATQQGDANLQVSGVTLKLEDEEVAIHTANGVPEIYTLYYNKTNEGGEINIGLFIDAATDANWIAWDEVELLYVGDKDKYMADYAEAVLGESMANLKAAVEKANTLIEDVDMNGVDFEGTKLGFAMEEAQYYIENPTDEDASQELFEQLAEDINEGIKDFYTSGVSPKEGKTFDFTQFIKNADFDVEAGEEWTVETEEGVLPSGTDCAYWWFGSSGPSETTQEFSQTLENMPAGNYLLEVNSAIRVDMTYAIDGYTAENLPNNLTSCQVYANNDTTDVHPFFYEDEAKGLTLESMLAMTNDWDYRHGNGTLLDYMLKQTDYFKVSIPFTLDEKGDIKIGFRVELPGKNGQMPFVDYFHLAFYGNQEIPTEDITAIKEVAEKAATANDAIYDLQGRKVTGQLTSGIYIRNGKKVLVK